MNRKTKRKAQNNRNNNNKYIGPWTIKEDRTLIQLVEKYGPSNWNFLSNYLPGRTGKQCRERWCNHLCPDINKSPWSLEEEMLLLLIHNKLGNKWSQITKYLKGRTDNTIKNHWNSTMKKKINFVEESLKNKKIEIKNRYKEKKDESIEKLMIEEFMNIIETQMKKVKDDKHNNYEKFKKIKVDLFSLSDNNDNNNISDDNNKTINFIPSKKKSKSIKDINNNNALNLRKILGFRTHSKKCKKENKKISTKKRKINIKIVPKKDNKKKEIINKGKMKDNKNFNEENSDNYKTPDMNKIINNISSSIRLTEDNSNNNKKINTDVSNFSAFRCINREENLSDKKYLLSQKYTPIKIITSFDNVKNDNNKEENNNKLELETSKKNLSLLFNKFD